MRNRKHGSFPAEKGRRGRREQRQGINEFVSKPVRLSGLERNAMKPKDLQQTTDDANLLSNSPDCDRLFRVMAVWWQGATWAQIADAEGISRQRAGRLLATVGCTRRRWCKADHDRADSTRRALPTQIAAARAGLRHPQASRLTVRQRAALAWLAQGLRQTDIAKRMVTTPQNVRNLLVAARWRLERLSRRRRPRKQKRERIPPGAAGVEAPIAADSLDIQWGKLFDRPLGAAPPEVARPFRPRRKGGRRVATGREEVRGLRRAGPAATWVNRGPGVATHGIDDGGA